MKFTNPVPTRLLSVDRHPVLAEHTALEARRLGREPEYVFPTCQEKAGLGKRTDTHLPKTLATNPSGNWEANTVRNQGAA